MKGSARVPSRLVLDSSVLIAYFLGEPAGQVANEEIFATTRKDLHCSHLALAETFYILCRSRGRAFAAESMGTLERTGYLKPYASTDLDYAAAAYKCERNLPLADCYVLALARKAEGTATFARKESDLATEERKRPFDVNLLFLQDIQR